MKPERSKKDEKKDARSTIIERREETMLNDRLEELNRHNIVSARLGDEDKMYS